MDTYGISLTFCTPGGAGQFKYCHNTEWLDQAKRGATTRVRKLCSEPIDKKYDTWTKSIVKGRECWQRDYSTAMATIVCYGDEHILKEE